MPRDGEPIIIALDNYVEKTIARSGSMSRVHFALTQHPSGLSLSEICDITGLAESTVKIHGIRNLFHFQRIEKIEDENRDTVYRLTSGQDISIASPEVEGARALEDVKR